MQVHFPNLSRSRNEGGACYVGNNRDFGSVMKLLNISLGVRIAAANLLRSVQVFEVEAMGDAGQPQGEAEDAPAPRGAGVAAAGK